MRLAATNMLVWAPLVMAFSFSASSVRAQCNAIYQSEVFAPDCEYFPGAGVWAIAENGDLAGGYSCGLGLAKPLAVFGEKFTPLPLPPSISEGRAQDVNSFMEVAGSSIGDSVQKAFLYKNGKTIQLLPIPGTTRASAGGIQAVRSSKVVGYSGGSGGLSLTAVYWQNGEPPVILNLPVGPASVAWDVNEAGVIVGWMGIAPSSLFSSNGFIWNNGITTDLGIPQGGIASVATCINNNNMVAGYHWVGQPGSNPTIRGWVWSKGQYTQIDPLPGYRRCLPKDINDEGIVVGNCEDAINPADPNLPKPAFMWRDGEMTALEERVTLPANHTLTDAMAINNAGQIAANAKVTIQGMGVTGAALRLTPVPPVPGDVNCDRTVDVDDLLAVINNWGEKPVGGDLNQDGTVDMLDLALVLDNWTF